MKKKNRLNVLMVFLLTFSIACNIFLLCCQENGTTTRALSYEEFIACFENFDENLELKGYRNLENNDSPQIVYIANEFSFGKREYLTLDNRQSTLQTQKRIEFEKNDKSELVVIDFIYLDAPLYEDLLYWNDPLWNKENEQLTDSYTDNIISIKNVLIKLSIFSLGQGTEESINKSLSSITLQVVNLLDDQLL